MNSAAKYYENKEHEEFLCDKKNKAQTQEAIYYLQRKLRQADIPYSSKQKIVFPSSEETNDKHVQKLLSFHNYTVQTMIK
jgi:hypothetical protein